MGQGEWLYAVRPSGGLSASTAARGRGGSLSALDGARAIQLGFGGRLDHYPARWVVFLLRAAQATTSWSGSPARRCRQGQTVDRHGAPEPSKK